MSDQIKSNEEEFQFLMMFHGVFLAFQSSYSMAEEGTLDSDLVDGLTGAILVVKDTPGMERYWRQQSTTLHPRFVRYVDELLLREGETPMEIYRASKANEAQQ